MLIQSPLIPIVQSQRIRAWPKHETGGAALYTPITEALTSEFRTDAHFTSYSAPSVARRLSLDALRPADARSKLPDGVSMVLAVFDVDCAAAHAGDPEAVDRWWIDEIEKVTSLLDRHAGGFVYRTRGGYRIVYVLPEPIVLRKTADADEWSRLYCSWILYLKRTFGIVADSACKDWPRLFRLPHATRDCVSPERRESIGDAKSIGVWNCEPSPEDNAAARRTHRGKTRRRRARPREHQVTCVLEGRGVLWHLLSARSEVGAETGPNAHAVVCPNEASHTGGEHYDSSTILYGPGEGEVFGHVHCLHAHCQGRSLRDTLDNFSPVELDTARAAAGIPQQAPKRRSAAIQPTVRSEGNADVMVPGTHIVGEEIVEVGTDAFARAVLDALPDDQLYRMDFILGQIIGARGKKRFAALDENTMRLLIDRHVRLVVAGVDKKTGEPQTVFLPCKRDYAALVIAAAPLSTRLRQLRLLVAHPVFLPGFHIAVPGWNENAGVYYDEPDELEGLVPRSDGAIDVLLDLVIDWPFADEASRQNVYGLMLTRILRPAILGPIPFHAAMASLERTGKGKLFDTALGIAISGAPVDPIQLGEREEEREKRITSLIIAGVGAVHFDNIATSHYLDSPALASLATAYPNWRGRLLGVSKTPLLPNAAVWVLSANNLTAHGEIVKRCVPIFLQPRDDHPELRTDFIHPDCYAYAKERRRAVLESLIGIVEAWKEAGRPECKVVMGGFERWVEGVGGPLCHAGAIEWMGNYTRWITSADDTQVDAEVLVAAWAARHRTAEVTAAELLELVKSTGAFRWVLAKPTTDGQVIAFGSRVLKSLVNRPVKNWIVRRATSGSSATYRLERAMA